MAVVSGSAAASPRGSLTALVDMATTGRDAAIAEALVQLANEANAPVLPPAFPEAARVGATMPSLDSIMATINARPDPFKGTEAEVIAERNRLLDSMAQSGTAGRQQYEMAKANAEANKNAALAVNAAQGGQINAPQALIDALAQQITAGTNQQQGYLAAEQGNWSNMFDAQRQTSDGWMTRFNAALPMFKRQSDDVLATNIAGEYGKATAAMQAAQQEAIMQMAMLQQQDWLRKESYKREDQLRAEDFQRQLEIMAYEASLRGGGGGGGGRGGGGGGSGKLPWQHDQFSGDPFGGLGQEAATDFVNATIFEQDRQTPWASWDDPSSTTANRQQKYDPKTGTYYWTRADNPEDAFGIANESKIIGMLDYSDWLLNGGSHYGVSDAMMSDRNRDLLYDRATTIGGSPYVRPNYGSSGVTGPRLPGALPQPSKPPQFTPTPGSSARAAAQAISRNTRSRRPSVDPAKNRNSLKDRQNR